MHICAFLAPPATLDGMAKQCSGSLTDGEEQSVRLRQIHSMLALLFRAIKGTAGTIGSGGWILPLAWNLRTASVFHRLLLQDCLLSEIDQQLPLAGHIPGAFEQLDFVERLFAAGFPMRA